MNGQRHARWFCVLTPKALLCYVSEEEAGGGGSTAMTFPLKGVACSCTPEDVPLGLLRLSKGPKVLMLQAESQDACSAWMAALTAQLNQG